MTMIVLGGINEDVIVAVDDLPRRGETIIASRVDRGAGGKGLNQAIAAARQGAAVAMLGAIGDDAAGAFLRAVMVREGIDTQGVTVLTTHPTGQAFIALAKSGDNTIIVDAGANVGYDVANVAKDGAGANVFLTQFEASLDAIEAVFTSQQARGSLRILNAAPAIEAGRRLLPLADIIVLNETELQAFAPLIDDPESEAAITAAARQLISSPNQHVIVTLGAKGCVWVGADDVVRVPGLRMESIDTIGAGDCFCGVFAAALDAGESIVDALRRANAAAALSVTHRGAGESAPTRAEVDTYLAVAP